MGLFPQRRAGFTLLEVMIAIAIFFIAVFAILDLTSQCLRAARSLKMPPVDATSIAAELSLTNRLTEGITSGDFGDLHPGYNWEQEVTLFSTNGLFQVDYIVTRPDGQVESTLNILLYRPDSSSGLGARGGR